LPVIIEDDVLVAQYHLRGHVILQRGGGRRRDPHRIHATYDLPRGVVIRAADGKPLVVPEGPSSFGRPRRTTGAAASGACPGHVIAGIVTTTDTRTRARAWIR
jgi:hypothetical protein